MIDFDTHYTMTSGGMAVAGRRKLAAWNPATRQIIARVTDATRRQLDEAVDSARIAFGSWSRAPIERRQDLVRRIGEAIERHAEPFMSLLTREQGKPRAGSEWEILGSVAWLKSMATMEVPLEILEDTPGRRVITRHTPLGVVGAIVPWNFPVLLAVWKIAPALLTGNTIVVKPSPFTPLCTLKLGELCRDILPPGVLNVVTGGDRLGKWMTAHPGIDKIAFTGHTDTGRHVMRSAADTLKRVTLELGGNDPAIVLPDVDIEDLAPKLFWAAFQNNAQFCNATKRLYIHESIYERLRDALVAYARTVKVGDGAEADTSIGPIQNEAQYRKVLEFIEDCRTHGYRFALGGQVDRAAAGWFIPITLVDDPPDNSRVVREEPFGPILPLLRWSKESEVIARANDTEYGLGASVWGRDLEAVERIGGQLEAGTVWLNEVHQYSPFQAFGGHKQSGIGCENSLHGLLEYTNHQTITLNKGAIREQEAA
ncbi:MAG: aldehyde dehydrogenase family protein [Gammaproteobacteria bacterium]|nr:aldehyde dehydrogenase family protein [Gammaproteobacteria bacterium]